jgi:hypothetical protein
MQQPYQNPNPQTYYQQPYQSPNPQVAINIPSEVKQEETLNCDNWKSQILANTGIFIAGVAAGTCCCCFGYCGLFAFCYRRLYALVYAAGVTSAILALIILLSIACASGCYIVLSH